MGQQNTQVQGRISAPSMLKISQLFSNSHLPSKIPIQWFPWSELLDFICRPKVITSFISFCHVINACGQSYKLTRTSKTNNFSKLLVIIQCWNSIFCRPTNGWEKSPTPSLARQDTWCREHMWEMVSAKQKSKMEKVSWGRKCILKLFGDLRKLEWLKWSFRISQCFTLVIRFQSVVSSKWILL